MILVKGNGDCREVQLEGYLKDLQEEIALACINMHEIVLAQEDEETAKGVVEATHKLIDFGIKMRNELFEKDEKEEKDENND